MNRSFIVTAGVKAKYPINENKTSTVMFTHESRVFGNQEEDIFRGVVFNVITNDLTSKKFNQIESICVEKIELLVDLYPKEDEITNWKFDFSNFEKGDRGFLVPKKFINDVIIYASENVRSSIDFNNLVQKLIVVK